MEKLFLIDAYALIYRSYYAFIKNPRINSKGLNTSAVLGFLNTLNEIFTKEQPAYVGVAFDHGKTFRHEIFPEYKAQRQAQPEDIALSVPIIKEILAALRIPCLQADGFEADDVIGTLAYKSGGENVETYMLTPDKDYAQLVGGNVYMYRPRHGGGYEKLDERAVCEKYDIASAKQVIDLLALMGDSVDNFQGCPGVGQKTAVQLVKQFGNVEEMLSRTAEITGKLREKVENNVENIRLAKVLAAIRTDVPIALDLNELRRKEADTDKLRSLFADLEFKTLLNKFVKPSEKSGKIAHSEPDLFSAHAAEPKVLPAEGDLFAGQDSVADEIKTVQCDCRTVETEDEMRGIFGLFSRCEAFSFALQTDSNIAIDARLNGFSLCSEEGKAYFIALGTEPEFVSRRLEIFRPLFENKTIVKIGHNVKYAVEVLRNYGIALSDPLFDTMIAHYLLQPELRHGFDYVAETVLRRRIGDVAQPSCARADLSLQLYNRLKPMLSSALLDDLFYQVEMPLVQVLADMEYNGVLIDSRILKDTSLVFTERMEEIERQVFRLAGHAFNISSPRQVGDVLFGEMKITAKPKKTKTGQFVTSEEELQKSASKHEIVRKILDYRALKKLVGTYVDALPQLVNPRTGHIHTSFNQTVTATGRLSSSDPNLQNIPIRGEDGREIRKCFVPEKGCLFFSADYSQIELRVMAHLSGDENMIESFREGLDIHASTAAKVYKKPIETVTRDERTKAKRANFGIIYGITTWGLAERLLIDRQEAKALIDGYFETFPKVKSYMEEAKAMAREKGYAETIFHRRRYLPDITSANATVRGFSERNAINAPIQGTAADIIKIAMVRIHKRFAEEGIRSKMILQVHDELNFSVFPEEKERVERIVLDEMQGACQLRVPLVADCGWGGNWFEAH